MMRNFVIPALLSTVLLTLGWLSVSGVPLLVALVPLLYICNQPVGFWRCALWVGVTMALWSALTTWWVWYAAPIGAIASVVIDVVMLGGVVMIYRWATRRVPRLWAYVILVAGWIAFEWVYTIGQISFPWLILGNGFANDIWAVQWYSVTGVFGGSLWVLVANVLLWEALQRRSRAVAVASAVWIVAPVALSLAMFYNYDFTQGSLDRPARKVEVTVVQPNIDPYNEKFSVDQYIQTTNLLDLVRNSPSTAVFVAMPETAIEEGLWEGQMEMSPSINRMREVIDTSMPGAQFIVGATTYKHYLPGERISATARHSAQGDYWYDVYNSALAIDSTGVFQIHHKSKLVVGAEMMPFYNVTKFFDFLTIDLGGITGQFGVDTSHVVFVSPGGVRTAAAVCYESVYGEYFSQFVLGGAQLMFVITNDGWWHDTPGHRQHFSFARLRAIETRRAIARSANTGISGFIDPQGRVLQRLGWDRRGSLTEWLPLNDKVTFYTRHGDYIGRAAFWLFLATILAAAVFRLRSRRASRRRK